MEARGSDYLDRADKFRLLHTEDEALVCHLNRRVQQTVREKAQGREGRDQGESFRGAVHGGEQ